MVPGSRQVTANFLSHRTRYPYFHFSRDNWLYWAAEKRRLGCVPKQRLFLKVYLFAA